MRNFRELNIWTEAVQFSVEIYKIVEVFPKNEMFGLSAQLTRAAVSIPSNIAEGCRGTNKELKQFLNIALGSSFEVETQLIIAGKVGYLQSLKVKALIDQLSVLQKRINAFRNSIK